MVSFPMNIYTCPFCYLPCTVKVDQEEWADQHCLECQVNFVFLKYSGLAATYYKRIVNNKNYTLHLSTIDNITTLWETGVDVDICREPNLLQNVTPDNVESKIKHLLLFS